MGCLCLIVSGGVLCEFLEVAFHLILYVREVYPPVVFERRKKYNVPVQVSVSLYKVFKTKTDVYDKYKLWILMILQVQAVVLECALYA